MMILKPVWGYLLGKHYYALDVFTTAIWSQAGIVILLLARVFVVEDLCHFCCCGQFQDEAHSLQLLHSMGAAAWPSGVPSLAAVMAPANRNASNAPTGSNWPSSACTT
eukprot:11575403-Ditylum_brightwellii.AAC.1